MNLPAGKTQDVTSYNPPVLSAGAGSSVLPRVVVDSSTCLDPAAAGELGVTVVPMHIVIDGRSYQDLAEISPEEFYRSLRTNGNGAHSTSAPSVGDYVAAFEAAPGDVLCLTVASRLSSMEQSASVAAGMVEDRRIRVLDTGTAAGGLRLLALRAAARLRAGMPLEEAVDDIQRLAPLVSMFGFLDSIEFLARSGRVPGVASWTAGKLGVKPVIELSHGRGSLVTLVRSAAAGRRALLQTLLKRVARDGAGARGEGVIATVFHADSLAEAGLLLAEIERRLPAADVTISHFTAAMGVHTGPGVLGHAF